MLQFFIHYGAVRNWSLSNEVKAQHLDFDVLREKLADICESEINVQRVKYIEAVKGTLNFSTFI